MFCSLSKRKFTFSTSGPARAHRQYLSVVACSHFWWRHWRDGRLMVNLTSVHSAHVSFAASGSGRDSLTDEVVEVGQLILFSKYPQSQKRDKITRKIAGEKPKILSVLSFSTHAVHMLTTAQMCPRGQKPVPQQVTALPRWKQKHPLESKNIH